MVRHRNARIRRAAAPLALGLALGSFAGPLRAQDTQERPEPHPVLGEPLVLNGEVIPFERIKRSIVFGPLGVEPLRLAKLRVFVEQEMERLIEAGADPSRFEISQEVVDEAIEEAEKQVDRLYEGQDVDIETFYPTDDELWLDNVRLTQLFNRVFLPENPNEYPPTTIEALRSAGQGGETDLYEHMLEQWERRKNQESIDDPVGENMMTMIVNQTVIRHLERNAEVVEDPSQLPEGVAMRVNGVDITVDEIWSAIEELVTPVEVEMAKRWVANTELLEEELKSTGHWIDDETAQRLYQEYAAPYTDSPFSIEAVAKRFQKFPTVAAYKQYFQILESMKLRIRDNIEERIRRKQSEELRREAEAKAERILEDPEQAEAASTQNVDELADEIFEELVDEYTDQRYDEALARMSATRTSRLAGDAKVQVDIILISAYDFAHERWKENGWEKAEQRTRTVVNELAAGLSWKDAVERYSDFYDPPVPTGQVPSYVPNNKGRFRSISRNELMRRLDESVYSSFLQGGSVTDHIFFEIPVGRVAEPVKGPYGYYIARLYTRGGPKRFLDFEDPDHRELIEQDFLQVRTEEMVQHLLETNRVEGI